MDFALLVCISFIVLISLKIGSVNMDLEQLYLAGLLPMSSADGDPIGPGVLPAIRLALNDVNTSPHILPRHHLTLIWNDTECDMAVGTKLFFDMMHDQPPKVMLFGGSCSQVTAPIAESVVWWDMWQLSFADTNPELSDRSKYPRLFRSVPSDSDYNLARLQLLRRFNWTRVGTLFQDASKGSTRYAYTHNKLVDLLSHYDIDREIESFASDPKPALTNLKQKDVRIVIGNFDENMARKVFCSVYKEKMFGPKHVWIIPGDYNADWWRANKTSDGCSTDELLSALEGHFSTDVLSIADNQQTEDTEINLSRYKQRYNMVREDAYSKFHGYAYDGIWVIARAIHNVIVANDNTFRIDNFRSKQFEEALNETNFLGVTGRVRFRHGDRVGSIILQQFQNGETVEVGQYNAEFDSLDHEDKVRILWPGRGPPRDRTLTQRHLQRINQTFYVILCTISSGGMVLAMVFLVVNIKYRKHRFIKMSSPNMNNIIILGSLLAYLGVFLLGTDGGVFNPQVYPYVCSLRTWIIACSFTFAFGAMFSKTWRVHAIFKNIKLNRKVIRDSKLLLIVFVLFCVDVIILVAWQFTDPLRRQTKELPPQVDPNGGDVEIIPVLEFCISDHITTWLAVIYAYKGLLLIVGCFLAWETRHVSIPALNDSKYIGMSVYNVVIMCVAGAAISFIVQDQQDAAYLIIGLFLIFSTTITLCLVFVPKILELRQDPRGEERRMRATLKKPTAKTESVCSSDMQNKLRLLSEENAKYRQILATKTRELEELLKKLPPEPPEPAEEGATGGQDYPVCSTSIQVHAAYDDEPPLRTARRAGTIFRQEGPSCRYRKRASRELIEIKNLRKPSATPCDSEDEAEPGPEVPFIKEEVQASTHEEPAPRRNGSRPSSIVSGCSRTPSYQGLKFLSEVLFLKETAILSDSEGSDVISEKSLPEHDDAADDVTKSLLS